MVVRRRPSLPPGVAGGGAGTASPCRKRVGTKVCSPICLVRLREMTMEARGLHCVLASPDTNDGTSYLANSWRTQ